MLQRVGERKAGYAADAAAPAASIELLEEAFKEIRTSRAQRKDDFQQKMKAADDPGRTTLVKGYAAVLELGDWADELEKTAPFKAADGLKLDATRTKVVTAKNEVVATLTRGDALFQERPNPSGGNRKAFAKKTTSAKGKDRLYVDDDRCVKTRQLAYVEKSIFQFMHFAHSNVMTGRFQALHEQMGQRPSMFDVKPGLRKDLKLGVTGPVSREVLAIIHQWKGSGLEQRGLSLTSTPREGAVFGNAGESFRSADGVAMTVDLAKVPANVALINHYAHEGVKGQSLATKVPSYDYVSSVIKNRELYLERLEPDWVVGIVAHSPHVKLDTSGKKGAALLAEATSKLALTSYLAGFRDALAPPSRPSTDTSPTYAVGIKAGTAYLEGWRDCKAPPTSKAKTPWARMNEQYGKLIAEDRRTRGHSARRDDYWIGWAHAAAGKPTMGGHVGLAVNPPPAATTGAPASTGTPVPTGTRATGIGTTGSAAPRSWADLVKKTN